MSILLMAVTAATAHDDEHDALLGGDPWPCEDGIEEDFDGEDGDLSDLAGDFRSLATDIAIEIGEPEQAHKTIADIVRRQKELAERGADLAENLGRKLLDFGKAHRELVEAQARAAVAPEVNSADATLKRYLVPEGKRVESGGQVLQGGTVLLRGYYDKESHEYVPGIFDDRDCDHEWLRRMRRLITERNLCKTLMSAPHGRQAATPRCDARIRRHLATAPDVFTKAKGWETTWKAFTDVAGVGAEWVIDLGLPALLDQNPLIRGQLESLFAVHEMQTSTELLPAITTGLRPYKYGAASGDDPGQFEKSSLVTAQRSITAPGMAVYTQIDRDAEEDAILNASQLVFDNISMTLADGFEDCLLNGDTTASHADTGLENWNIASRWGASGLGGSNDHRRCFIGLREFATQISNNADLGSAQTFAGLMGGAATLTGRGGMFNSKTCIFMSKVWYLLKLVTMTEFKTADLVRLAAGGGNESGQVPVVAGMPVHLTDFMSKELTVGGIYDNSDKTKTGLVIVNTERFWVTRLRQARIEADVDITRNIRRVVATQRKGFFSHDNPSSPGGVDAYYGYNLSIS